MTTTVSILLISSGAPCARASPAAMPERPATSRATVEMEFFIERFSDIGMTAPEAGYEDGSRNIAPFVLAEMTGPHSVEVPWQLRERPGRYPWPISLADILGRYPWPISLLSENCHEESAPWYCVSLTGSWSKWRQIGESYWCVAACSPLPPAPARELTTPP